MTHEWIDDEWVAQAGGWSWVTRPEGLPKDRVAKSVNVARPRQAYDGTYCVVLPSDRRVDFRKLPQRIYGTYDGRKLVMAEVFPKGQAPGRLGPFPQEQDVADGILKGVFFDRSIDLASLMDYAHPTIPDKGMMLPAQKILEELIIRYESRMRIGVYDMIC